MQLMVTEQSDAATEPTQDATPEPSAPAPDVETNPDASPAEPALEPTPSEIMETLKAVQGQARKAEQVSLDLARRLEDSDRKRDSGFASLVSVLDDEPATPLAVTPEDQSKPSKMERFQAEQNAQAVSQETDSNQADAQRQSDEARQMLILQGRIEGLIAASDLEVQDVLNMQQAAAAMGDSSLQPMAQDVAALENEWRQRLIPEIKRRKAESTQSVGSGDLNNSGPQGTPPTPSTTGAAGFKTFSDVETAFNEDRIDTTRMIELAEKFPQGRAMLERLRRS
jgi:hypothetical protein